MNERRDPATGELTETVDLVPILLAFYKFLLDYYLDQPANTEHVLCCMRTLLVGMVHMTDEKINVELDIKSHYKVSKRILDIGKTSIYNYNEEFKKIPQMDRFCDFETIFQIMNAFHF